MTQSGLKDENKSNYSRTSISCYYNDHLKDRRIANDGLYINLKS